MHAESLSHSQLTPLQLSASAGRVLIGIKELSEIIHKSPATIATWVTTAPHKLPPRFQDGSNSVLWLLADVWDWMEKRRVKTPLDQHGAATQIATPKKTRGRPPTSVRLAALRAGMTTPDYIASQQVV